MALFSKTSGLIPNRRRGEWNALLLVMFALLAVAPSVLSAAPLRGAASQPQAVWQWLQSPEGAPARDLLARSLDLELFPNLPPDEWATLLSQCGMRSFESRLLRTQNQIENSLSQPAARLFCLALDEPVSLYAHSAPGISRSAFLCALPPHQAAFRSGTRTNSRLE